MTLEELEKLLSAKEILFCHEWVVSRNGKESAIKAGYSEDSATVIASQNLTKLNIQKYIKLLVEPEFAKLGVTKEVLIKSLSDQAFYNIQDAIDENGNLMTVDKLPKELAFAITEIQEDEHKGENGSTIKRKYKFADKLKAAKLIGDLYKLFNPAIDVQSDGKKVGEVKFVIHNSNDPADD